MCSDKEDKKEETNLNQSAYILCQGSWMKSNASIFLYDLKNNALSDKKYLGIGDVVDDGILYNDKIYMASYGDNQLLILDTKNGKIDSVDLAGAGPQSVAIANDKIYITCDNIDSVYILKLSDYSKIKSIYTGSDPWAITAYKGKVYVANTEYDESTYSYGQGKVAVIENDSLIKTIEVGTNPTDVTIINGALYVLCTGDYYSINSTVYEYNIDNYSLIDSLDLGYMGVTKLITYENEIYSTILYSQGFMGILKYNISLSPESIEEFLNYGTHITINDDNILVTKSTTYSDPGFLFILNKNTKEVIDSVQVGIAPSYIIVK